VNKRIELALLAVLETCVGVFGFGTLSLMSDLGYRLEPLVFEKDLFGIPGWFTVIVLRHQTGMGSALLLMHLLRIVLTVRLPVGATRWVAWVVLAGIELMTVCFWFFMVASAVLSSARL
jgi:hypothetical protein